MVWSYLKGYVTRHNSSCKKKDIIKLFEEVKSHIDAERWAKFETHLEREFEEKLRQLDGIRDEDVNPVVIDMTDDDSQDSQRTIPYMFSEEEEEGNDDENDNDFEDSVSDTINDADEILCNTCGSIEPPKPIQKDKYISWFQCDACDQWVHNRCCTKPALAKNVCLWCFSIFNHRNLSEPLISPLEEMEQ
ncbi:RSF1 [Mytilus coruscus]|uniref:RSF1 n=1 Tax=Mytilus coruscus TaxID=42192 RepID=A0A6J8AYV6_MYTCO|nr:RSF1 [Mytilus coruscus]